MNASVRAERDRSRPSLDRAVEMAWAALSAVVPGGRGWPIALRNLAAAVNARISAFGEDAELDDAVDVLREAVNHTGDPVLLDSLGVLLSACFRLRGDAEDLDRAVQVKRRAVDGPPLDSPERAGYLINLATSMAERAVRSRDDSALAEAVERGIEAVDAAGAHRPRIAGIFAQVLVKSYQTTGATQLLAEGIGRLRGVATLTRPGRRVPHVPVRAVRAAARTVRPPGEPSGPQRRADGCA